MKNRLAQNLWVVWDIALPQYINNVAFVADIYIKNKKTLDHDIYKTKIQAVNNAGQGRLNSVSTDIRTHGAQDNERV